MKHFTYSQLILFGLRLRVFSAANVSYNETNVLYKSIYTLILFKVIRHSSYLQQSAMGREQQIKPIFKKVLSYENHECIRDINGQYRYLQLYKNSKRLARQISNICGNKTVLFLLVILIFHNIISRQWIMFYDSIFHFKRCFICINIVGHLDVRTVSYIIKIR